MNKLKFNPDNEKYYSEDFIKGFECGVERQFNADMADKTAEWNYSFQFRTCSKCGCCITDFDDEGTYIPDNYCPNCGARMNEEEE